MSDTIKMLISYPDEGEAIEDIDLGKIELLLRQAKAQGDYLVIHPKGDFDVDYPCIFFANDVEHMDD